MIESFETNNRLFNHYLKEQKYAKAYDIVKIYIDDNNLNYAIKLLLSFKQVFFDSDLKSLEIVYNSIKDLLEKKYTFLNICSRRGLIYDNNNVEKERIFFYIDGEFLVSADIFSHFINHQNWRYYKQYQEMITYYRSAEISERSFDKQHILQSYGTKKVLLLKDIISKRLKYYSLSSVISFGKYIDQTVDQLLYLNPLIITDYINNLSHFTLGLDFWIDNKTFEAFGERYWELFEKNVIKTYVLNIQFQCLQQLKDYQTILTRERKETNDLYTEAYKDYFENDSSNLWNVD